MARPFVGGSFRKIFFQDKQENQVLQRDIDLFSWLSENYKMLPPQRSLAHPRQLSQALQTMPIAPTFTPTSFLPQQNPYHSFKAALLTVHITIGVLLLAFAGTFTVLLIHFALDNRRQRLANTTVLPSPEVIASQSPPNEQPITLQLVNQPDDTLAMARSIAAVSESSGSSYGHLA